MKAGKMGHNGFQIGQTSTENPHALHISFSIEKSTSETANTAKVQIWTLSHANLSILDTKDCVIELQAGYANHIALILAGNVVTSSTEMDGADRMTELEVVDGRVAFLYINCLLCSRETKNKFISRGNVRKNNGFPRLIRLTTSPVASMNIG